MGWYRLCCWFSLMVMRCSGLRFRFEGRDNVPRKGGFILAANHISNLDPPVLAIACPRAVNFMAKEELFRNRVFGALISSVGAFPVKRGTADLHAIRTAFGRVRKGGGLLLFPQGGRRPLDDNGEPEPGIGMLSQKMQVPIVPAFISGTEKALPPAAKRITKGVTVTVRFGAPVLLEKGMDNQAAASLIMSRIRSLRDA